MGFSTTAGSGRLPAAEPETGVPETSNPPELAMRRLEADLDRSLSLSRCYRVSPVDLVALGPSGRFRSRRPGARSVETPGGGESAACAPASRVRRTSGGPGGSRIRLPAALLPPSAPSALATRRGGGGHGLPWAPHARGRRGPRPDDCRQRRVVPRPMATRLGAALGPYYGIGFGRLRTTKATREEN